MLTAERLREVLDYDQYTGLFARRRGQKCTNGTNGLGYVQIMVDGKMYAGHRLAWLYVHGHWPIDQIDHVNGVKSDNRLVNLRECTQTQNRGNNPRRRDNSSGLKGAIKFRNKWCAQIQHNGIKRQLGVFDTPEEAHAAYKKAAMETFGKFARFD